MVTTAAYHDSIIDSVRDVGAQGALDVDPDWREAAEEAIERLAATGRPFTDEVRWTAGDPPSPNALGAVILAAAKRGVIESVGWSISRRVSAHGRAVRLWRGTTGTEWT